MENGEGPQFPAGISVTEIVVRFLVHAEYPFQNFEMCAFERIFGGDSGQVTMLTAVVGFSHRFQDVGRW